MQITFDPHNPQDVELVVKLIDTPTREIAAKTQAVQQHVSQASPMSPPVDEDQTSGIDSAKIFAGNATVPATSAQSAEPGPAAEQTGAASADPAQQAGQSNLSFDSAGIPWDARIHAETKAQKKDGTWRTKRGVDKDYVKQITDELRAQHSDVSQATIPPVPGQGQQEATAPPPPTVSAPTNTAPPPPTTVAPTTASAGQITTFPDFMKAVTQYMAANGITMIDINNMLSSTMGIQSAAMLSNKPELIPQALANIGIQ